MIWYNLMPLERIILYDMMPLERVTLLEHNFLCTCQTFDFYN